MKTAEFRESPLLASHGFRHAFFTRKGGVSTGPYASLSFSTAAGDSEENVRRNLALAGEALGVRPERIYYLSQVHGVDTRVIRGDEDREDVLYERGDAVVTRSDEAAAGVRIADCAPVLVADRRSGAVAAIHAGWRGTVAGVVGHGVRKLREVAGDEGDLVAAIGPHISVEAFEVGEEVAEELVAASPDPEVVDRSRGPKPHVDLRKILRAQLRELGLEDDSIDDVAGCTVGEPEHLFSYRRDGKPSGRHLAAIVARR